MLVTTRDAAATLAQAEVTRLAPEHHFQLIPAATREHVFGWSFSYAPADYLRTGNPGDLVPGNGPLIVERSGEIDFLPSSLPPSIALAQFEAAWRKKHPERVQ